MRAAYQAVQSSNNAQTKTQVELKRGWETFIALFWGTKYVCARVFSITNCGLESGLQYVFEIWLLDDAFVHV